MRESIGVALDKSLKDGVYDCPITRIAAFSRAPRLGTVLWRLKYGKDHGLHNQAVAMLAKALPRNISYYRRILASTNGLDEWLNDKCRTCRGAKELIAGKRRIACPQCDGLGMQRHTRGANSAIVDKVLQIINTVDQKTARITYFELDRAG